MLSNKTNMFNGKKKSDLLNSQELIYETFERIIESMHKETYDKIKNLYLNLSDNKFMFGKSMRDKIVLYKIYIQ